MVGWPRRIVERIERNIFVVRARMRRRPLLSRGVGVEGATWRDAVVIQEALHYGTELFFEAVRVNFGLGSLGH